MAPAQRNESSSAKATCSAGEPASAADQDPVDRLIGERYVDHPGRGRMCRTSTPEIVAVVNAVVVSLGGVYQTTTSVMVTMGAGVLAIVIVGLFLALRR